MAAEDDTVPKSVICASHPINTIRVQALNLLPMWIMKWN